MSVPRSWVGNDDRLGLQVFQEFKLTLLDGLLAYMVRQGGLEVEPEFEFLTLKAGSPVGARRVGPGKIDVNFIVSNPELGPVW